MYSFIHSFTQSFIPPIFIRLLWFQGYVKSMRKHSVMEKALWILKSLLKIKWHISICLITILIFRTKHKQWGKLFHLRFQIVLLQLSSPGVLTHAASIYWELTMQETSCRALRSLQLPTQVIYAYWVLSAWTSFHLTTLPGGLPIKQNEITKARFNLKSGGTEEVKSLSEIGWTVGNLNSICPQIEAKSEDSLGGQL